MSTTIRFCWLCDEALLPVGETHCADVHYETGRTLWFCGPAHHAEYAELKAL